jgi:hypothetical protein
MSPLHNKSTFDKEVVIGVGLNKTTVVGEEVQPLSDTVKDIVCEPAVDQLT